MLAQPATWPFRFWKPAFLERRGWWWQPQRRHAHHRGTSARCRLHAPPTSRHIHIPPIAIQITHER